MNDLNRWQGIGYLGADPEIRYTPNGTPVANFRMATNSSWTDKSSGEKRERTEWHILVAFGKLAEIVEQYCKTGTRVFAEGSLRTDKWEDADGKTHYTTKIVAKSVLVLSPKPEGNSPDRRPTGPIDDDIPF